MDLKRTNASRALNGICISKEAIEKGCRTERYLWAYTIQSLNLADHNKILLKKTRISPRSYVYLPSITLKIPQASTYNDRLSRTSQKFQWVNKNQSHSLADDRAAVFSFLHSALVKCIIAEREGHTYSIMVTNTCTSPSQMVAKAEDATSLGSFETLHPQTLPRMHRKWSRRRYLGRHPRGILMNGLLYIPGQTIFSSSDKTAIPDLAGNVLVDSMVGPS